MKPKKRYWELDFFRGTAIISMIAFHLLFDLDYFGFLKIPFFQQNQNCFAAIIASSFLLTVGVSLSISFSKARKKLNKKDLYKKYFFRGLKIFSLGLLVTSATWVYPHQGFILFGILHLIGLSIILSIPFLEFKKANLIIGLVIIAIGLILQNFYFNFPHLLWFGLMPRGFYSLDYYPLLPWFGVVLGGLYLGKKIYPNGKRGFKIRELGERVPFNLLSFLGRHSLLIYLLHQPLLVGLILLVFGSLG